MRIVVTGCSFFKRRFCAIVAFFCLKQKNLRKEDFLEIVFLSNGEMRKFNQKFRNQNFPTDVLSFPGNGEWIGSVLLSVEKIREYNPQSSLQEAIHKTLIHGVLHILGYDHDTPDDAKAMRERETEVYEEVRGFLGVA